eukprot:scpid90717/ scgid23180/ Probable lysozyme; Endolysin; Lysis protein; Muramidase; P13
MRLLEMFFPLLLACACLGLSHSSDLLQDATAEHDFSDLNEVDDDNDGHLDISVQEARSPRFPIRPGWPPSRPIGWPPSSPIGWPPSRPNIRQPLSGDLRSPELQLETRSPRFRGGFGGGFGGGFRGRVGGGGFRASPRRISPVRISRRPTSGIGKKLSGIANRSWSKAKSLFRRVKGPAGSTVRRIARKLVKPSKKIVRKMLRKGKNIFTKRPRDFYRKAKSKVSKRLKKILRGLKSNTKGGAKKTLKRIKKLLKDKWKVLSKFPKKTVKKLRKAMKNLKKSIKDQIKKKRTRGNGKSGGGNEGDQAGGGNGGDEKSSPMKDFLKKFLENALDGLQGGGDGGGGGGGGDGGNTPPDDPGPQEPAEPEEPDLPDIEDDPTPTSTQATVATAAPQVRARRMSKKGLDLVKSLSGLRLNAYVDPVGVLAIGYGHTKNVRLGQRITVQQANRLLLQDVAWAENAVNSMVRYPVKQSQFDALVSFTFSVGAANFKSSTLLKVINAGQLQRVPQELRRWNKGTLRMKLRELPGLVVRREKEIALWNGE